MKLTCASLKEAQDRCDKIHTDLIASDFLYAASAAAYDPAHPERGGTARWAIPMLNGASYDVAVDNRSEKVLSVADRLSIPEMAVQEVLEVALPDGTPIALAPRYV